MEIWLIALTIILIIAVISLILAHVLLHFTKPKNVNNNTNPENK